MDTIIDPPVIQAQVCTECLRPIKGNHHPSAKKLTRINRHRGDFRYVHPVCVPCLNVRRVGYSETWSLPIQSLEAAAEKAVEFDRYEDFATSMRSMDATLAGLDGDMGRLVREIRDLERRKTVVRNAMARIMALMEACPHARYFIRRMEANKAIADPGLRQRIMRRDGYKCQRCQSIHDLSIDHITPVVAGGGDEDENLQVLCVPCNSRKGGRK